MPCCNFESKRPTLIIPFKPRQGLFVTLTTIALCDSFSFCRHACLGSTVAPRSNLTGSSGYLGTNSAASLSSFLNESCSVFYENMTSQSCTYCSLIPPALWDSASDVDGVRVALPSLGRLDAAAADCRLCWMLAVSVRRDDLPSYGAEQLSVQVERSPTSDGWNHLHSIQMYVHDELNCELPLMEIPEPWC
jgi:hypothetical protein